MTTKNSQQQSGDSAIAALPIVLPLAAIAGAGFAIPLVSAPTVFPSALMVPIAIWWVIIIFSGRARLRRAQSRATFHGALPSAARAYLPAWQQIAFAVCIAISTVLSRLAVGGRLGATAAIIAAFCLAMAIRNAYAKRAGELERDADARTKSRTAYERLTPNGRVPHDEWAMLFAHMGLGEKFRMVGIEPLTGGDARVLFRQAPGTTPAQLQSLTEAIGTHWNIPHVGEVQRDYDRDVSYVIASLNTPTQTEPEDEWN
ncbi:hypothetical protein ACTXJJ_06360 [Corynebacterium casei]|uniref:hypothetical protein n=1 Tax=Corynebacterium casei TaxID=160386 RepID=UPI003FB87FFF